MQNRNIIKNDDFLKKIIITLGIFLTTFTVVNLILFAITGTEPSTLIVSVFAACIGEYSICGLIKTAKEKNKKEEKKEQEEDVD